MRNTIDSSTIYRCPDEDCSWEGPETEMGSDFSEECWSNWICPGCGEWHSLEDYNLKES